MPLDPIYLPLHSEIFQPLVCHYSGKYFLPKCESELEQKLGCVSGPRIRGVDRINSSLCFHSEHVLNARFFSNSPKLATSHLLGGRVYCFPFYLPAVFLIFALSICCKNPQKSELLEQITISVCVSLLRTTSIFLSACSRIDPDQKERELEWKFHRSFLSSLLSRNLK